MRALPGRTAVLVITMLALVGCKSGGSGWSWNRKNSSAELAAKSDPALPSAGAAPVDYASPQFTTSAAATSGANSAFAAPAVAAGTEASPYANQAGYTPPASPYGAATQTAAAPAGAAAMQQQGSYADAYGAAAPPAATPAAAYPSTGAPAAAYPSTTAATPAADPYAANDPYGTSPSHATPPVDHYGAAAAGAAPSPYDAPSSPPPAADPAAAYTADARYGSPAAPTAPTAQPEQAAAGGYGAPAGAAADPYGAAPAASPAAEAPVAGGYQPGSTNYAPGQTGYNPPGVAPYTVPAEPNVVAQQPRKDPYYRPGGTSDYVSGGKTPTAVADRYSNPTSAYSQPDPYMPADGSHSPATGYTQ